MLNLIGNRRHNHQLERTKYEIASITFSSVWADNLSANKDKN